MRRRFPTRPSRWRPCAHARLRPATEHACDGLFARRLGEQLVELRVDLALDCGLEGREEEAELHVERDVLLADVHASRNARTLEVHVVAVPGVVEIEALLEVLCDALGCVARLL